MQNSKFHEELLYQLFLFIILITSGLFLYFISRNSPQYLEQTTSKLVFTMRPKLSHNIGIIIGGIALVFLLVTLMLTSITELKCSRSLKNISLLSQAEHTLQCELLEIGLFDNQVSKKVFSQFNSVNIEAVDNEYKNREATRMYQLLLSTDLGNIPFKKLSVYTKNYKLDHLYSIASSINYFIKNPSEKTLSVTEDNNDGVFAGFIISIFLGLLALLITATGTVINCTLNKETNSIIMLRYKWFGQLGKNVIQHSLDEIKDVKLEHIKGEEGGYLYRISFVLNSDEIIPLTQVYSSSYQNKQQLANCVKSFINSV